MGGVWRTTKQDSTGYCSSTVEFLQPPPHTVHPRSTSTSLHQLLFIHGVLFIQPPGLLFIQPSTGYYSSSPPPAIVQPALHGVILFIKPSTGSYSSSPNRLDRSGSCSSRGNTTGSCSSTPPRATVHPALHRLLFNQPFTGSCSSSPTGNYSSRGSRIDRLW